MTNRPPLPELAEQHLIIACDATQATAIARARTGASYIIQGPPGTGKSQTITNLIADYVARGKRVLFVCEKRAAIDVVFHRLRQQGLDELCCLIHDSQTDKKAFIQNLKQTYESFSSGDLRADVDKARSKALRAVESHLESLRSFSDAMQQSHEKTGVPLRSLLHRLVETCGTARERPPEVEDSLPDYALWNQHGDTVSRLRAALEYLGEDLCFANHPLRWLGKGVLEADRPLEAFGRGIDHAEKLLDAVDSALQASGLAPEHRETFDQVHAVLHFAERAEPLAEANQLVALAKGQGARAFNTLAERLAETSLALIAAQERASPWHAPLSPDDTQNAIEQARSLEKSVLRFLRPSYWRLRNTVRARYDFAQHAVAPTLAKILSDLSLQHEAQAAVAEAARAGEQTMANGRPRGILQPGLRAAGGPSRRASVRQGLDQAPGTRRRCPTDRREPRRDSRDIPRARSSPSISARGTSPFQSS